MPGNCPPFGVASGWPGPARTFDAPPSGTFHVDRVDRVTYLISAAPPAQPTALNVFTMIQDVTEAYIVGVGLAARPIDWYGINEYHFALNRSNPHELQLGATGNVLTPGSDFAYLPLGSLQRPKRLNVGIKTGDVWQIVIRPQANLYQNVAYNLWVRTQIVGIG